MKRTLYTILLVLSGVTLYAQSNPSKLFSFVQESRNINPGNIPVSLFTMPDQAIGTPIDKELSARILLELDKNASQKLYTDKPASISFLLPGTSNTTLELVRQDINTFGDFSYGTLNLNGPTRSGNEQGLHYRGYISGDPMSIAAVSIFAGGDLMGMFCNKDGNFNLGKTGPGSNYVLYNHTNLLTTLPFECATNEIPVPGGVADAGIARPISPSAAPPALLCKKVRVYWEGDYKLFANDFNSSVVNTANYLTGLFNQVATLYQNEGILIELTETYIWSVPDPYTTNTSSAGLSSFKSRWNGLGNAFNADLAVLIDGGPTNNGGVAYLLTNNLCNRGFAYGYANVYGTYNAVPVYSWDVEVVTHEMGHMMGSKHTHWCGWNTGPGGTCGAIDNCYATEASTTCTTCNATTNTNPTAPAGFKGTIMSYCHLRSGIGINLANGFGPLPQAAIRNTVNIAGCAVKDNKWTGDISTAWEDPGNWGCNQIPDATTDVTISSGLLRYPIVTSAAVCRRIIQAPSTSVLVKTGFTLMIAGPPSVP